MFEGLLGQDSSKQIMDILNNLLEAENIELKTDLNISQVQVLVQLKWFEEVYKESNKDKSAMEILGVVLNYYLQLMVSLKRKSREEIVSAIKELKPDLLTPENLMSAMSNKR